MVFRNISSTTCALRGYPGVRLLDSAGRLMPPTPRRGSAFVFTDPGPTTIVLPARDGEASFAIGGEDYDQVHQRECPTAAKIAVYAPDTRNALVVVTPFPACRGITFSAVVAGRLGPRA